MVRALAIFADKQIRTAQKCQGKVRIDNEKVKVTEKLLKLCSFNIYHK